MKYECQEVDSMNHMHLSAYKTDLNPLSTHNNNNSPHKFEFKFHMLVGDQKLEYNLEWPKYLQLTVIATTFHVMTYISVQTERVLQIKVTVYVPRYQSQQGPQ